LLPFTPLLFAAVALSGAYGGARPALLAGGAAALGQALVAALPSGSLQALGLTEAFQGALLIGVAVGVGRLSDALVEARGAAAGALGVASESATALELEKRRTETVLQSVSDGIAVQDASGRFVFVNDAAANTLGYRSGDLLAGRTAAEVLAALEPRDELDRAIPPAELPGARALAGEPSAEQLVSYRSHESGGHRWALVRARSVRDEAGEVVLSVSAVHDLTERIRYERALEANARDLHQLTARLEVMVEQLRVERESALAARAEAEAALERLVVLQRVTEALSEARTPDQVADVVLERAVDALGARSALLLAFGAGGDTIEVARAAGLTDERLAEWMQASRSEVVRLKNALRRDMWSEDAPARDGMASAEALRRALGAETSVTVPLATREGPLGVLAFDVPEHAAVDSRDHDLLMALGRQCAQALERARLFVAERGARDEAEQANRAKSQFLAVMSHELRTPLNAILGYEELLETEVSGPISPVQKQHLARIRESTKNLLALIEQILSLSRVQSGKEDVRIEEIDAAQVAREVAAEVEPQLLRKGLVLELALPPDGSLGLHTDARKVRQILFNVLSNAAKFTDRGTVRVSLARVDGALVYTVQDTGRGIEERDREHIFEPFVQVWADGTPPTGTGLGLPVARELARHLGGDVTLESQLGEGSSFTIRLPHQAAGLPPSDPGVEISTSLER
jgi:PAS domain S-box-containing protein